MAGRRQTARSNRSTSSASPTRGESHGRARTWCGKQRPKADLPARWPRSRPGAGPTGIGLHANSAPGCLQYSTVTTPTTASRGTFGSYRSIATKSCGSGTSGWNVEREDGCSHGLTSTRSSPGTHCQRPGSFTATPDGTNLTHEEPDAGILLVRVCGGRGGNPLAYPANTGRAAKRSRNGSLPPDCYRARRKLVTEGVGQIRPSRGAAEERPLCL